MSENLNTCVEPYLDSFAQELCRRQLHGADDQDLPVDPAGSSGALMDEAGIEPSALTLDHGRAAGTDGAAKEGQHDMPAQSRPPVRCSI